jgi:hypothetical protein
MSEYITECTLISAYDAHYSLIKKQYSFCDVIFLDSGGYEASVDFDMSDAKRGDHTPRNWQHSFYRRALRELKLPKTTTYVIISYDNPKARLRTSKQVERARQDFKLLTPTSFVTEFLIKPYSPKKGRTAQPTFLDIESIEKHASQMSDFQIIGVTEKELGRSMLERMINIARIRRALSRLNTSQPIHIFGALDPISVPLYFFAGADIFDGLTWLRYAYYKGMAVYISNYSTLQQSLDAPETKAITKCFVDNLSTLATLQRNLRTFVEEKDFGVFGEHAPVLRTAVAHFQSSWEGL